MNPTESPFTILPLKHAAGFGPHDCPGLAPRPVQDGQRRGHPHEDDCEGVKTEGGVITKATREIEILCSAGDIPESIEVDVTSLMIGDAIRLTDLNLPEGSEIPGLSEETDQLVVSVNAPKAVVEEEPEIEEGEALEADGEGASDDSADEGSSEEQENSEETSE